MLNAYLERDLKVNGGVLDTVLFALVKYTMEDLKYGVALQARNPWRYIIPRIEGGGWDVIWRHVEEPGAFYVKIDDDITFVAPGAMLPSSEDSSSGASAPSGRTRSGPDRLS